MSAKMKPREGEKTDGSKFHTPKYIKVTPVSIAPKEEKRELFTFTAEKNWTPEGAFMGVNYAWSIERKMVTVKYTLYCKSSPIIL